MDLVKIYNIYKYAYLSNQNQPVVGFFIGRFYIPISEKENVRGCSLFDYVKY